MHVAYIQYLSFTACQSAVLVHQSPVHVVLLVVYLHFRAVCVVCRQRSGSVQITANGGVETMPQWEGLKCDAEVGGRPTHLLPLSVI
ncbi:unnamed protein product [Pieris macdunnoughi]|uniref:Uncharacterized protein n=1 Tax=Pieris macdunnoughi TaxID=345717 RepID=A0A821UA75_9NEOP|nr:unnamed protein product [Pieris macdunnoughi]